MLENETKAHNNQTVPAEVQIWPPSVGNTTQELPGFNYVSHMNIDIIMLLNLVDFTLDRKIILNKFLIVLVGISYLQF